MLFELYREGYFDYRKYLFDNASKLDLNPNESNVLLYLLDDYYKGNKIISINKMLDKILLHKNEITQALVKLLERSLYTVYVAYENDLGVEKYSVESFFKYIEKNYNLLNEEEISEDDISKILAFIEKKLKRVLTANEYDIISQLVTDEKKSYEDFKNTISYIEKAKYDLTVRNIQKFIDTTLHQIDIPKNNEVEQFMKKIGLR